MLDIARESSSHGIRKTICVQRFRNVLWGSRSATTLLRKMPCLRADLLPFINPAPLRSLGTCLVGSFILKRTLKDHSSLEMKVPPKRGQGKPWGS